MMVTLDVLRCSLGEGERAVHRPGLVMTHCHLLVPAGHPWLR